MNGEWRPIRPPEEVQAGLDLKTQECLCMTLARVSNPHASFALSAWVPKKGEGDGNLKILFQVCRMEEGSNIILVYFADADDLLRPLGERGPMGFLPLEEFSEQFMPVGMIKYEGFAHV